MQLIHSKIIIFITISIFALSSCSSGGWSKADKDAFMDECVGGAEDMLSSSEAKRYCKCVLGDLMDDYNTPEDALSADLYTYALECL